MRFLSFPLPLLLYDALWRIAKPLLIARLRYLARRRHPGYGEAIGERFGQIVLPLALPAPLWLHAVSVGETRAAEPLVAQIRRHHPTLPLLITHTTPTARAIARTLWAQDPHTHLAWAPYDARSWTCSFLAAAAPRALLLLETELWPNWLFLAAQRRLPLFILNARLSERSFRRYRRWQRWLPLTWDAVALVAAQTPLDAERYAALGAKRIEITGNLKFDCSPDPLHIDLGKRWRAAIGERPVILLASTRDGEEALFLPLWRAATASLNPPPLLVLVPRHPERADAIAHLLRTHALRHTRRSQGLPSSTDDIWLGDSLGELTAYYAMADVALIGGSWLPHGGQNPLEALAVSCPALLGPHTHHFAAIVAAGEEAGALETLPTPSAALDRALFLLTHAHERARRAAAGQRFLAHHRGATDRTWALLSPLLFPSP
ncbi:MAG: 3-deoxy-D-manno-octulosonic acid transferase [Hydrogenophilus sp.]|nr:3-deoxy-D-manno-octulosonic acid transferase [Hydrogenophilus sp.]